MLLSVFTRILQRYSHAISDAWNVENMALRRISPPEFDVELAIAYSTSDNITGKQIYCNSGCWLHEDAAEALLIAIGFAKDLGLKFRIFDAFRPLEAQWNLWNHNPDPKFLVHPQKGSPHSRGVAIDLTLIKSENNNLLNMGTDFDDFSEKAFHNSRSITPEIRQNRCTLLGLMVSAGWDYYLNEWWHYQLFNSQSYESFSDSAAGTGLMKENGIE